MNLPICGGSPVDIARNSETIRDTGLAPFPATVRRQAFYLPEAVVDHDWCKADPFELPRLNWRFGRKESRKKIGLQIRTRNINLYN